MDRAPAQQSARRLRSVTDIFASALYGRNVVRVHKLESGAADNFPRGITRHALNRRRSIADDTGAVVNDDDIGRVIGEQSEAFLALTQLVLEAASLGNVEHRCLPGGLAVPLNTAADQFDLEGTSLQI